MGRFNLFGIKAVFTSCIATVGDEKGYFIWSFQPIHLCNPIFSQS
jgi:hypothetical protein